VRAAVLALLRSHGWNVHEQDLTLAELTSATEVWLTNSLIGVRPIQKLDEHEFSDHRPKLAELRAAWTAKHGWDPGR
jgi:branched-subunit amino acid aminotransferase/4-amino-4-deoxychorismate lyase